MAKKSIKDNKPRKVVCAMCGDIFETVVNRQIYCSKCGKTREKDYKKRSKSSKELPKPFKEYYCCGVVMGRVFQTEVYVCKGDCKIMLHEKDIKQ